MVQKNYKFKIESIKTIDKELCKFMKVCKECGKLKLMSCYSKDSKKMDKKFNKCKECSYKKSKSRNKLICEYCGKEFTNQNKNAKFCSRDCNNKYLGSIQKGENNPRWKGGDYTVTCDYCGKQFIKKYNAYNRADKHFCSPQCHGKWKSENCMGENNPNYKKDSHIKCICDYCNKEYKTTVPDYNSSKKHFCSRKCQAKWQSENIRGENHPMYGKPNYKCRGENNPNWNPNLTQEEREQHREIEGYNSWRTQVYRRDNYTCICCGDNKGGNLNAHHLNGFNWDKEHRLDVSNGVTLCTTCHNKFHSLYGNGNNTKEQFINFMFYNRIIDHIKKIIKDLSKNA